MRGTTLAILRNIL